MEFSIEEQEVLYDAYLDKTKLEITGCNGYGQEFTTSGSIASIKADEFFTECVDPEEILPGIDMDCLVLEMGKKEENSLRTPYSASFYTDLYSDEYHNFLIKEIKIKKTGKTIYLNKDYAEYYELGRELLAKYGKELMRNDVTPGTMDGKCQQISHHIGKPLNIYGNSGVLYFVDNTYKNNISLFFLDFTSLKELTIPKNSTITESKNGLKISEPQPHKSFEDFLLDQHKHK